MYRVPTFEDGCIADFGCQNARFALGGGGDKKIMYICADNSFCYVD